MKNALIAASLGVALAVSPAVAKETKAPQTEQKAAKKKIYCFEVETTGSRLTRRVCQTKSEWRAEGIDVDRI